MLIAALIAVAVIGLVVLVVAVKRAPKGSEDSQGFRAEPQAEAADPALKPAAAKPLRSKGTA
ncbi:MAG TPA: hypothetical protein VGG37_01365 [Opitutaceae bacterium]